MSTTPLHRPHHHPPHHSTSLPRGCCCCCLLFIITFFPLPIASATADLNSDRQALLDFSAAVPHPLSRKLNWNTNSSLCTSWAGVTCSTHPARVVALRIPAAGFYGSIPPSTLGRLDALSSLSLRSNRLYGPLPPDILSLPSLRYLYFQHNNFSGDIPSSFSSHLNSLDLSFNSFTGNIPAALNNLTHLAALNLQNNSLTGPIPDLSALSGLQQLNLSNNKLNCSIPPSLQRFPASSFHGNPLCGTPLSQCPSVVSFSPSPAPLPYPPSPSSFENSPYSPATLPSSPAAAPFHKKRIVKAKLSTGSTVAIAVASSAVLFLLVFISRQLCCTKKKDENQVGKSTPINNRGGGGGGGIEKSGRHNRAPLEDENSKLVFLSPGLGVSTTTSTTLDNNFDLDDLLRASAEVLGKGTYGTTYKAILDEGTTVAVKRLKQVVVGKREFEQHMQNVGRLNGHPNVVPLRAYYYSKDEKLLLYDYAPFGNLSTLLHGKISPHLILSLNVT